MTNDKGLMTLSKSLRRFRLLLLFFGVWSIDLAINYINHGRSTWVPIISLDAKIPFVPFFIYFYTIYFPLVVGPLFLLPVEKHLRPYVHSSILVMIASYIVFLAVPTQVLRVAVNKRQTSEFVTSLYHRAVGPYNLLPSLHISMLILAFLSMYFWKRKVALWLSVPILLSCASVLFTKQHYILDVVAAVPVALIGFAVTTKNER
jgi:PAP2 superfamily